MLTEEFLAAMKALRNFVLHGRSFVATKLGADRVVLGLLLFEERIATDPCQNFAVFREQRIDDLTV